MQTMTTNHCDLFYSERLPAVASGIVRYPLVVGEEYSSSVNIRAGQWRRSGNSTILIFAHFKKPMEGPRLTSISFNWLALLILGFRSVGWDRRRTEQNSNSRPSLAVQLEDGVSCPINIHKSGNVRQYRCINQ